MKQIFGKQVYDSLGEVVSPAHTAILVVDMQKDFCSPRGYFDKAGFDITPAQRIMPNIIKLIDEGRKRGARVVWIQNTTLKEGLSDSPAWLYFKAKIGLVKPVPYTQEGTWGQEFAEGLEPQPNEPVVKKHRSSGFVSSDLDLILKSNRVESVIVCGTVSHGCVEFTARAALDRGYYVSLASDCVCSPFPEMHQAVMKRMPLIFDVITLDELLTAWG